MHIFLLIVFGLVWGSFLGAYTYRYPRGKSVLKGRSFCPQCGKKLAWFDNIPLLSFLLLKGRCRSCRRPISLRNPAIELATAGGFVGIWFLSTYCATTFKGLALQGSSLCLWRGFLGAGSLPFFLIIFIILLAIFVMDLEEKIIPDELVFLGLGLVVFSLLVGNSSSVFVSLVSGFGAAVFLLILHLATSGRGMGLGDVKFALFGGTLLGWPAAVVWLFLAFLTGAAAGIILVLTKKLSFGKHIAFGPFLIISLLITFVWGEKLINLFFP